jgi:hypothetical protein
MPSGTGANVLSALPEVPFTIDPRTFALLTEGNTQPLPVVPTPGSGLTASFFLPKSGVCSFLQLKFIGTLTVTTAGVQPVPGSRWPYGLLNHFQLSAGLGAELFDVNGLDLAALRQTNKPKLGSSTVDQFPGAVGGGGSGLTAGSYPLFLSYDIPIAVDQTSLIASLFLQSSTATIQCNITQEATANLIAAGGTVGDWTITGNWYPSLKLWDVPVGAKGELILPEINRVHLVVGINQPLNGTGQQPAAVQRTAGVLQRLFLRTELSPTGTFLSALPSQAASGLIDQIAINYGLTNTPLIYNPASLLASKNNDDYGGVLPYDTYVIDTLIHNPARDAILLQGVTNLQAQVTVDPAVTVPVGAVTRVVEEILV